MIEALISKVVIDWLKNIYIVQLLFDFQLWKYHYYMYSVPLYMIYIFLSTFTHISFKLLNNPMLITEILYTQMWNKYLM